MTTRILPSADSAPAGPRRRSVAQVRNSIRFRLAIRLGTLDRQRPEVLDLLADVRTIVHEELHGCASRFAGERSARHWRDAILGERALRDDDLGRLYLSTHPQVRAAAVRIHARLGAALEATRPAPVEPAVALARVSVTSGELGAEGIRALADGRMDSGEAVVIEGAAEKVRASVDAVIASARRGREARA